MGRLQSRELEVRQTRDAVMRGQAAIYEFPELDRETLGASKF